MTGSGSFQIYLANGITGMREMESSLPEFDRLKQYRAQVASGKTVGPELVATAEAIEARGPRKPAPFGIHNAADARSAVDRLRGTGADFVTVGGDVPRQALPGIGAFQAGSAALKMSPPYGYDTNAVILTMSDWPGRVDLNEKLMAAGSTMVFYTMNLDYPLLSAQLRRFYPGDTPVAVVCDAGDQEGQKVVRSTVSRFLDDVKYRRLPVNRHILFVGKFLEVGQARKDFTPRVTAPSARE
jgi:hypothetical protein